MGEEEGRWEEKEVERRSGGGGGGGREGAAHVHFSSASIK